jgi:hypothetical protein
MGELILEQLKPWHSVPCYMKDSELDFQDKMLKEALSLTDTQWSTTKNQWKS